jgi:hypothetical protein
MSLMAPGAIYHEKNIWQRETCDKYSDDHLDNSPPFLVLLTSSILSNNVFFAVGGGAVHVFLRTQHRCVGCLSKVATFQPNYH